MKENRMKRLLSLILAVIMVVVGLPLCAGGTKAQAAEKYLTAKDSDWNNLEKMLLTFNLSQFTDYTSNTYMKKAYKGYTFKKNSKTDSQIVSDAFLRGVQIMSTSYKKYLGNYKCPSADKVKDPLGKYYGYYYKIPKKNMNWVIENFFNVTAYNVSDDYFSYYCYGDYYYVGMMGDGYALCSSEITNISKCKNGSYNVDFVPKYVPFSEIKPLESGNVRVNVCLRSVDGKRIWRINSIKRHKTINDAYYQVIRSVLSKGADSYAVYDIDKDGTTELIVSCDPGFGEAERKAYVYTYNGKSAVKLGTISLAHRVLHGRKNKNGLYEVYWNLGYEIVSRITINNGKLKTEFISERETYNDDGKNYNIKDRETLNFSYIYSNYALENAKYYKKSTFNKEAVPTLAVNGKTTSVEVKWRRTATADGYRVYIYNGKKCVKTLDTTKRSAVFKKLSSGTEYTVKVKAYRVIKGKKVLSEAVTYASVMTKPAAPSLNLTAGSKKVTLKWNRISGVTGYNVYMSTSKNGKYQKIATVNGGRVSYTKTGLTKGKTYYFKVASYKMVGKTRIGSSYSEIKSVKVK